MSTRGRAVITAAAIRERLQSIVSALVELEKIRARVLAAERSKKPTRPKPKNRPGRGKRAGGSASRP